MGRFMSPTESVLKSRLPVSSPLLVHFFESRMSAQIPDVHANNSAITRSGLNAAHICTVRRRMFLSIFSARSILLIIVGAK